MQDEKIQFLALVDRAPLTPEEKEDMKQLAEAGVDRSAWRRLDDMIVASLKLRRLALKEYRESIDVETRRITEKHEDSTRAIDAALKQNLERVGDDDAERERLWAEYYGQVHEMQERLLDEMKQTSTALKQKAFRQVSRDGTA